ncbi:MAG: ABC transporter ATP-binding protein [Rhodobacteraceae bacterium]|nr:ABC transporter ATP-binding protein [Paracoccaceae bacterium]
MTPLLKVRNLSVSFVTDTHRINAVRNVSFDIAPGEKLGFVGESGSGKTTTALALMGLVPNPGRVTNGIARLDDLDLFALSCEDMKAERLRTISYIPQGAMNSLNPVQKIRDSVLDGMEDHGVRMGRGERRAVVGELMERAGLPRDAGAQYPHELSGGMKQRACIAIAVALRPKLLIADEPTSALDVITQRRVMQTLERVQGELGSGLILIGHDMGLMAQFVDRLLVMREGRIVEVGSTRQVFKTPRAAYTQELITSVPAMPVRQSVEPGRDGEGPGHIEDDDALLSLENASKTYRRGFFKKDVVALKPVSLRFSRSNPKIIAMVGQSGSGKSACGNLMLGFQKPTTGRIMFGGRDVATMNRHEKSDFRRQVQAVFQDPYASFNPFYTIDHAFTVPLRRFGIAANRAEAYDIMADALQRVGLEPGATFGSHAHQLSGGQRQRIMVARAVALRPKFIVADEPVSMVDASLRATILENIRQLRDDLNISVFYITHDLATAHRSSDGVIVLRRGRIVEAGLPDEVICDPKHPYTVQLVESIPSPDPDQTWARVSEPREIQKGADANSLVRTVIRSRIPGFSVCPGTAA